MRVVLSAYPDRVDRWGHLWGEFTVFAPSVAGAKAAHLDLARHAVGEGWDEGVLVHQDDVDVVLPLPVHHGDVTSYAPRHGRHVCPKAFTASTLGWELLTEYWALPGSTCRTWAPGRCYDHWIDLNGRTG